MKTWMIFAIFLTCMTTYAQSVDLGQLAPKKAKAYLKTGEISLCPELKDLADDTDPATLKLALELGLKIQSHGNESMIYDLKALIHIAKGAETSGTLLQKDLYSLTLDLMATADDSKLSTSAGGYAALFQMQTTLRVAARLSLMGHDEEALKLTSFMRRSLNQAKKTGTWGNIANLLLKIRMQFSNTGETKDSGSVGQAQDLISHLPSSL